MKSMKNIEEQGPSLGPVEKTMGKLVSFGLDDMVKIIGASLQHPEGTRSSGSMLTWQRKLRRVEGDPYGYPNRGLPK